MSEIESYIKSTIADELELDVAEITNEKSFMDDLGAQSMELMNILMTLEDHFDITLDQDLNEVTTVQVAIDFVKAQLAA